MKPSDWSNQHLPVLGVGYALNTWPIIQTLSLVILEMPPEKTVCIQPRGPRNPLAPSEAYICNFWRHCPVLTGIRRALETFGPFIGIYNSWDRNEIIIHVVLAWSITYVA